MRADYPPELAAFVRRAIDKDPAVRFETMRAFAEVLAGVLDALGDASHAAVERHFADALERRRVERERAIAEYAARVRRGAQRPNRKPLALALGVALLALAALFAFRSRPPEARATASAQSSVPAAPTATAESALERPVPVEPQALAAPGAPSAMPAPSTPPEPATAPASARVKSSQRPVERAPAKAPAPKIPVDSRPSSPHDLLKTRE